MNPAIVASMIKRQTAGQKKSNDGAVCAESTHERCNLIGTVSDAPSRGELKTGRLISANLRDACPECGSIRLTEEDGRLHCDDCGVLLALNRQPKADPNYTEKQVED